MNSNSLEQVLPVFRPAPAVTDPETVINPERRALAQHAGDSKPMAGSSIWNRLFPAASEVGDAIPLQSPAGLELGHFTIEERIGAGGMGAVFRAVDNRLQRIIALKVLSPEQSRDSAAVMRFRNEARAAAQLDNDNIARVFYIGEDEGLHFIAFEYVTGTNVRILIRDQGQLDVGDSVNYVLQIASALRHTSANGVVHRDIKPSNIIITPNGRAKLVDLGLARKESKESAADLTLAGTTLGTFDYISPEQAKDPRNVDVRSDIYSLGCTLYHMLTGEAPYPDGTVLQKLLDHQGKSPPDPALKNRRVPEDLSAVVFKMMASDPRRRYESPDVLIRDLMHVAGTLGLRGTNPEGLVWMSSKPPRPKFFERNYGLTAMLATLLIIVGVMSQFPEIGREFDAPERSQPTNQNAARDSAGSQTTVAGHSGSAVAPSSAAPSAAEFTVSTNGTEGQSGDIASRILDIVEEVGLGQTAQRDGTSLGPQSIGDDYQPGASSIFSELKNADEVINGLPPKPSIPPLPAPTTVESNVIAARSTTAQPSTTRPSTNNVPPRSPQTTVTEDSNTDVVAGSTAADSNDPTPISVIAADGTTSKNYRTLEAACSDAEDGSVIELRFNGPRREAPIRITKKSLTLRAAKGFRPVIEFLPEKPPGEGYQTRMITVVSGKLNISSVNLLLTVPREFPVEERLSLISLQRAEQFRLRGATVTVLNSGVVAVAVTELTSQPVQPDSNMKMMTQGLSEEPSTFEITECVIRGGTDLIFFTDSKPVEFQLSNSLIAVDGSALHVQGNRQTPAETARLGFKVEHVTCLTGENFVKMDSGDQPRDLLPVHVSAENNIFAAALNSPLIAMLGQTEDSDFRGLLDWKGEKNFYDAYSIFWTFPSYQNSTDFEKWKLTWGPANEVGANNQGVSWQSTQWRDGVFPFSVITPEDAGLDDADAMTATDGSNVGADLQKLPILPRRTSSR